MVFAWCQLEEHARTLINPVFLSSSYLTLLPFVISTTYVDSKNDNDINNRSQQMI